MSNNYTDANGLVVEIKPITAGTMRRALSCEATAWIADLQEVLNAIDSPVRLSDLVAFLTGREVGAIDDGLRGVAIVHAQNAVVKAFELFYPGLEGVLTAAIEAARKRNEEQHSKALTSLTSASSMPASSE